MKEKKLTFVTNITNMRLLPSVSPHMLGQLVRLAKGLLANAANVRSLPGVRPHMRNQVRTRRKRPGAHRALMRLLPRVGPHVLLQILRLPAPFITNGAAKRSFVIVHPQMNLVIPAVRKSFIASLALVWEIRGVGLYMSC